MHLILARTLTILSIFTYSSTALILPQISAGPQNDLGYNIAESSISPPTVTDSKTFLPTSISTIPSDTSPATPINQHINSDPEPDAKLPARNLGPFGKEGFNIATYLSGEPTNTSNRVTSQILAPVPSITADPSWRNEHMTPTTTVIVPASTVYYTEATVTITQTTITVTARGVDALVTGSAMLQVRVDEASPPHTFHTITGNREAVLSSLIPRRGNEKRGFENEKEACEALGQSEVLGCLEAKGLLVPWTTRTEMVGGKTMVLVEVSVGAGRGRRGARATVRG